MKIEVTEQTFKTIINQDIICSRVDVKEHHRKMWFYNKELEQKALVVDNFTSLTTQYFLIDINA